MHRVTAVGTIVLVLAAGLGLSVPDRDGIDQASARVQSGVAARDTVRMPPAIASMVARSCADCHSASTRWPWYAALPGVGRTLRQHVAAGRAEFDLPSWRGRDGGRTARMNLGASCYDMREGIMPPKQYVLLHSRARLSTADIAAFCRWAAEVREGLPDEGQ